MLKPGYPTSYGSDGAEKPWYVALNDPGFNQMKHLKNLMLSLPYFERVPDQSIIAGENGERYNRLLATRGNDYLLVYIAIDASKDYLKKDQKMIEDQSLAGKKRDLNE